MKRMPPSQYPRLRAQGLVIHDLPDEVLVYDKQRDQAHCLNETATLVWRACDGRLPSEAIAQKLTRHMDVAVSEEIVMLALAELEKAHLLEPNQNLPDSLGAVSRRQMIRTLGLAASVALPIVTTIMVPPPAQAATCTPPGQPCSPVKLCCTTCNPAAPGGPTCV